MISVCMATFNGEKYIKDQIDSIIQQLSPNDELIISDDGSTDSTLSIINAYKDNRIHLLTHSPNKNSSGHKKACDNFENAIKNSSGDIIFLTDQDDIWQSNKIEICLEELEDYDFLVHDMAIMDSEGKIIKENRYFSNPLPKNWLSIIMKMNLWGCCMVFKRKCLQYLLPFPKSIIVHDYWIVSMCLKKGKCKYIDKSLIKYREHADSVSYKRSHSLLYRISYRLNLMIEVIRRK